MPVQTFNAFELTQKWTLTTPFAAQLSAPWTAIDIYCNGIDVVCEIQEDPAQAIIDSADSEILMRSGFSSRPLPAFYAVKFKIWDATALAITGTADITLRT